MKIKASKKPQSLACTPIKNKQFFIGIALGDNTTVETGIAILNRNLELIRVDKLFTNKEIINYLNNFPGTVDSIICMSLAANTLQPNSKWRQNDKNIHPFSLHSAAEDLQWTDRFTERGKDLYSAFNESGVQAFRYHIHLSKVRLNLIPPFKNRSQPGCKYLQTVIKDALSIDNLPNNLIPIASLDAIIGAYTGWKMATDEEDIGYSFIEPFKEQAVVVPLKINPRPISHEDEIKPKAKKKKKKKKR